MEELTVMLLGFGIAFVIVVLVLVIYNRGFKRGLKIGMDLMQTDAVINALKKGDIR